MVTMVTLTNLTFCPILLPLPPRKFPHPPFSYYPANEIQKHDSEVAPNGTTSIPIFIHIRPVVLQTNHANGETDGWTDNRPATRPSSCNSCKERIKDADEVEQRLQTAARQMALTANVCSQEPVAV